jgi:succinate-semialdehyde dehydrogenase/glutarate-semialdehyde dehydrogenase
MYTETKHYPMYVAGEWADGESEARMEATSPATGERIGTVPEGTREDVRRAIAAANEAWSGWAALSAFERAAAMTRIAQIIEERRDDLAETLTLDQGKPLRAEAYDEVDELIAYFDMASADATRLEGAMPPSVDADKRVMLYRVPRGVVGVISPWNWPYTMPAELVAPALACGNAVVWVPAPSTSICAVKLAECIVDAGLPSGVFNMVTGPGPVVGDEVAANPGTQAVGFIGSIETGQKVAARAAGKTLLLEMGGNGPMVILDDADLEAAAEASLTSAFLGAGQSCTAGEREGLRRLPRRAWQRDRARHQTRRPLRPDYHARSPQQRTDGRQDGSAHLRCARGRRGVDLGRGPRRGLPYGSLLPTDRTRQGHR